MSAYCLANKCSPFNPSASSIHRTKYEPNLSEFSASFTTHQVKPKFNPQHVSMLRSRRSDSGDEHLLASATHRDFTPHSAINRPRTQITNTRASAMNHLDPSKTFSNVTNSDEIYRSEKNAKFQKPVLTGSRAAPQAPSHIFPTQKFNDSTTSRDYCPHDLSVSAPKHVFASGQPSSIPSNSENFAKFDTLSTSAHDYPNHSPQPVRLAFQPPRSTTNHTHNDKPLDDSTIHKQFFIPHSASASLSTAPLPIYHKEPLEFYDETAYNHFYSGHRNVPRTAKYHPIPGNLFSSLPSDMNTQTAIHYPPKQVTPYFAPVPITYSAPTAPLIDDTSQRIDFPAYHSLSRTTSAKPKPRPITGEFYSTTTTASLHKPLPLLDRPPPAVDKLGILLPRETFHNDTTTRSTYQGISIARPQPIVPQLSNNAALSGIPLEHDTVYKHSYNYPRPDY